MIRHFINKSKKILAGAMAVLMMASSTLLPQAHAELPKEETVSYIMGTEEALYGTRTWKFDGSEGSYADTTKRKDIFEFNTMTIDATQSGNGVAFNEGSSCTQFEPTVTVTIPSVGNYTLSIEAKFWNGATVTVDGKESEPQNGDNILTFKGETKDGAITFHTANNGVWVKSISVTCEKPISAEDLYGTRIWKFDGSEGSYTDTTKRKDIFEFNTMTIDATQSGNGVSFNEGSNCTQFEPTVTAIIPSAGNYTLSIEAKFWNGATVTVDGKESEPQNGDNTLIFKGETKDGAITVHTANNGIWVKSISVICEKPVSSEVLYGEREWKFDGSEGSYTDTTTRKDIFEFNTMTIDATNSQNGVHYNEESACTQFEPTVTVTIPAVGNYQLTVTGFFYANATISVDGKESGALSGDKVLNFSGAVKDGVITLVTAGNGAWIKNIKVNCTESYDPISSYVENRKIDVWDFGGVEETDTEKYINYIQKSFYEGLDASLFKSRGIFENSGQYEFGDLVWVYQESDRIYYNNIENSAGGTNSADAKKDKYKYDFGDGYTSLGAYYVAGKGSSEGFGSRYVEIKNVLPGDVITAYMMVENADMDLHFLYEGSEGEQDDVISLITGAYTKKEFTAEYAGTYKLYLNNGGGKPRFLRVTRTPDVLVKGNIDLGGCSITDYQVILEDKTSGKRIEATLYEDGTFAALVPANTTLTAILAGAKGYGFTDSSKGIITANTALENINLVVEAKSLSVLSGKISGFASDFDPSNLKMTLSCTNPSLLKEDVILEVKEDWTYTAQLENDVTYQLTMTGANDYELTQDITVTLTGNDTKDIAVKAKEVYLVSGNLLGLKENDQASQITFINLEDDYCYTGTITADSYTGNLRTGEYEILAPVDGYTMVGHIVVEQSSAVKDLLYISTAEEKIDFAADLYVGYPADELEEGSLHYDTVREAVKACAAIKPASEAERITVHIYPGVYREQVVIETPYLTFVNDYPEQEVLLTWYYGVGYKYYSASKDGYYDENLAFDKYSQNSVNKWGASVYIKSKATDFRAENITFETSFNRYMTQEEIEDGAQPDMKEAIRVQRVDGLDVTTKTATERACALAVDADRAEFKNCTILGSQDTLFIQLNTHTYFKECLISGNTDYIFGDGDAVFDTCELQWYGYRDQLAGGYITAMQHQAPKGCLFLNCTVTSNKELQVGEGCFGRPWREGAHVVFLNTVLESESMIREAGWSDMSGGKAENSFFREFNTTLPDGTAVDTSKRVKDTVMSAEEAAEIRTEDYFAGWEPYYYKEKEPEVDPDTVVSEVESFEDFTITIPEEGIQKQEIMAKVPTSAAVTCVSGKKTEATVIWDDSNLEEIYTEAAEFTLTGILAEFEDTTVTIKVILIVSEEDPTQPSDPEEPTQPSTSEDPTTPSEPEEPTQPSTPEDPTTPSEQEEPTQPSTPEDPTTPSEPEEPTQPSIPEDPTTPSEPEESTQPSTPEDPSTPDRPSYEEEEDDEDEEESTESDLTDREQNQVEEALGSSVTIQDVVESDNGKLVISVQKEIVFCEKDGTLSKDKWQKVDGSWYYFGSDSKAVDGWLKTGDKWYYMDQTDKKMETGWLKTTDGKWYLLDSVNGDMKNGWQQRGGKWYLLDEVNGDMKIGWQLRGGKWYLLDSINGDMKIGWHKTADDKWYYMNSLGEMAADTITPDGYKVGPTGAWIR